MTNSPDETQLERVVRRIEPDGRLRRAWPLTGGVSAQVIALEIERPDGHIIKRVLRRHGAADLQHNPHIATDEFSLLRTLHAAGLPVPTPYLADSSGELFGAPGIALEYVEGTPEFAPSDVPAFVRQCAATLAQIHQAEGDLALLPDFDHRVAALLRERPSQLDQTLDEGRVRAVLQAVWPLPPSNDVVLLHGDFWPGNLLWKDGQLAAVIDWEDAARGDPLADLANSRLEMLWVFGEEVMHEFTQHYQSLMTTVDFTYLPYRDLGAALHPISKISGWGLGPAAERVMRTKLKAFVGQAFDQLPL